MKKDPIVEEIDRYRAEEMERLGYDFEGFFRELEARQEAAEVPLHGPPSPPREPQKDPSARH